MSQKGKTEATICANGKGLLSADTQSHDSGKAQTAYSSQKGGPAPKQLKIYRIKREKKDSKSLQSLPRSEDRPDTPPSRESQRSIEREQNKRLRNCLQTFDKYKKAIKKYGLHKNEDKLRKCCAPKERPSSVVRPKSRSLSQSIERVRSRDRKSKCSIKKVQN